ncbi:MAG: dTDP-glucose 4,6-dehydratase [Polyangiales bacterium]
MSSSYLVTGGAGFIGSNLVHHLLACDPESRVTVIDRLTYAGNLDNLEPVKDDPRFRFVHGDICDAALVKKLYAEVEPTVVFNLAAESHVDRSIDGPGEFVRTNVQGTFELLDAARHYAKERKDFRFVHVSTDEVFGSLGEKGFFTEESQYQPNSPYAASKASADHLARAYFHTFGLQTITTNCSNNYGPYQFPEKLIPLVTLNALEGKALPVYGDGLNIRDWLYVEDHCAALRLVAHKGTPGEVYCIGGHNERTNIHIVKTICAILDRLVPGKEPREKLITYVKDRPGHDKRYAIDPAKIGRTLGWSPATKFEDGIEKTIRWYLENRGWCERITQGTYRRERLGLGA